MIALRSRWTLLATGGLIWCFWGSRLYAATDPSFTVLNSTGTAGASTVAVVQFSTGTTQVSGFQLDLSFPADLTISAVSAGAVVTGAGKVLTENLVSPGLYRILVIGLNASPIDSGPAVYATFSVSGSAAAGNLFINVVNAFWSSPSGDYALGQATGGLLTVLSGGAISLFNIAVANVTATDADITWMTDTAGDSHVDYGLDNTYGSTVSDGTSVTSHSLHLSSLAASTIYHFKVQSGAASSGDLLFSTDGGSAPNLSVPTSSVLGFSSATITWTSDIPATSQVLYGTNTAYGYQTAIDPALALSHSITLTGLSASTLYHFMVRSQDAPGNVSPSGDGTFTTDNNVVYTSSPMITNVQVLNVTPFSADFTWDTDHPASSYVRYGQSGVFFIGSGLEGLTTSHTVHVSGLTPSFSYEYNVLSQDSSGLVSISLPAGNFQTLGAAASDYPVLTIGSGSGAPGSTVDIDIQFAHGLQTITSLNFDIGMPLLVSGASVATGAAASAVNALAFGSVPTAGQYRVSVGGIATTFSQSGTVATVRLAIDSGAFPGTYPLAVARTIIYDSNGKVVVPVNVSGTLVITGGAPVQIRPNPWRSDLHSGLPITFANLTPGSDIRIFTTSGYFVRELRNSTNSYPWDLKNEDGNRVASGLYYYLITSPTHEKVRGELVVIH